VIETPADGERAGGAPDSRSTPLAQRMARLRSGGRSDDSKPPSWCAAHPRWRQPLAQQLHGLHVDAASLRRAFPLSGRDACWPDRSQRRPSSLGRRRARPGCGCSHSNRPWRRRLRTSVDARSSAWEESSPPARGGERPAEHGAGASANPTGSGRHGVAAAGRGRRGGAPRRSALRTRSLRRRVAGVSRSAAGCSRAFNSGLALTVMARAGAEFYAWAPTATQRDRPRPVLRYPPPNDGGGNLAWTRRYACRIGRVHTAAIGPTVAPPGPSGARPPTRFDVAGGTSPCEGAPTRPGSRRPARSVHRPRCGATNWTTVRETWRDSF